MTKNSTLIYQFIFNKKTQIYNLQELLEEDWQLKNKLKEFKEIRLKSPEIEVLKERSKQI